MRHLKRIGALVVISALFAVGGCSLVDFSSTTHYRDGEGSFSAGLIDEIAPEKTTDLWLRQQFGSPLWVDVAANDVEILTWQFRREVHKRRQLLFIVRSNSVKTHHEYLHVVLQNRVVVKHWQDKHENVDVARVVYALGLDKPQTAKRPDRPSAAALSPPPTQIPGESPPAVELEGTEAL